MFRAIHISLNGTAYDIVIGCVDDIAGIVRERSLESLTSADGRLDFWFTPLLRGCNHRVNKLATELLLAATRFNARTVPLMRGNVVLATHDHTGALAGLTHEQIADLAARNKPTSRDDWMLAKRYGRDERRHRRIVRAEDEALSWLRGDRTL